MRNGGGRRSPPKTAIAPIHVDELLSAPGMNGLLGVLHPPSDPVLRELKLREEAFLALARTAWKVLRAAGKLNGIAQDWLARAKGANMRKEKAAGKYAHRTPTPLTTWQEWVSADVPQNGQSAEALRERIARLAYSYWEERGCPHGSADEDWYRAEEELRRNE